MNIPEDEIWFSFSRSGGPGGQNVNKVSSKVTLRWNLLESRALPLEQKQILLNSTLLKPYLLEDGIVSITSQLSRSQTANRRSAFERLQEVVSIALKPRKARRKTKKPRAQIEKRLRSKKLRGARLSARKVQAGD